MSEEERRKSNPHEISWRDYVDIKFIAHEHEHELINKALDLADQKLEYRLERMNELREENMSDKANFLAKSEYYIEHKGVVDKIENLQKFMYLVLGGLLIIELIFKYMSK